MTPRSSANSDANSDANSRSRLSASYHRIVGTFKQRKAAFRDFKKALTSTVWVSGGHCSYWWGSDAPGGAASPEPRRWKWCRSALQKLPRWSVWCNRQASWHPWPPAVDRRRPSTGQCRPSGRGRRGHTPWERQVTHTHTQRGRNKQFDMASLLKQKAQHQH